MKKIGKVVFFSVFIILIIFGILGLAWATYARVMLADSGSPLFPNEMNDARDARTAYVVGDLGGVSVRIPSYFANYVEYEGDPGFGERRKGAAPKRTYESRLTSFGFKVRFPDMAALYGDEMWNDYQRYSNPYVKGYIGSISPWLNVGVSSGVRYPGVGFLDRYVKNTLEFNAEKQGLSAASKVFEYKKLPDEEYGLTVYAPPGIDPKTNQLYRQNRDAKDLFVHHDKTGRIDTYIECSNANNFSPKYSSCNQHITLEPEMRVDIHIQYPRYWLPHWSEIQKKVGKLIWEFKAD